MLGHPQLHIQDLHVVVLMAGSSDRFLASGGTGPKQLALVGQKTLSQLTLDLIRAHTDAPIHVVVAPTSAGTEIAAHVEGRRTHVTVALLAANGLHESAYHGLQRASKCGAKSALLMLGDDPMATHDIPAVLAAADELDVDVVAANRPSGGPHPIWFRNPSSLLIGDLGLGSLRTHSQAVWLDLQRTIDVDTVEDLRVVQDQLKRSDL
jgi:CTP:molybdopterin cytidylyltransferase MocA